MSLQVWLPLNGNTNNQGAASVVVSNKGAVSNDNGKIGKCCYFDGASYIKVSIPEGMTSIKNMTLAMWVKGDYAFGGISHDGDTTTGAAVLTLYDKYWQFVNDDDSYMAFAKDVYTDIDKAWHHVACTISDTTATAYLDGIAIRTMTLASNKITTDLTSDSFIEIGADHPGGDEFLTGYVNDFRIYDRCLSAREVREISKGIVCHYPLNQSERFINLISDSYINQTSSSYGFGNKSVSLTQGKTYTLFANGRVIDGDGNLMVSIYNSALTESGQNNTKSTSDTTFKIKFTPKTTGSYNITAYSYLTDGNAGGNVHLNWYKLVEGDITENIDWSPNPSDSSNWGLDEYDISGYGNNAQVSSIGVSPIGVLGSPRYSLGYRFSPTQNLINRSLSFKSLTSSTISYWAKIITSGESGWVVFSGQTESQYIMASKASGDKSFYNGDIGSGTIKYYEDGVEVTTPSNDGEWHHYVISGVDLSSWTELHINMYNSKWNSDLCLSDIRIYNTILSDVDIKELCRVPFTINKNGTILVQGEVKG